MRPPELTRDGVVFAFSGCTPIAGELVRALAAREPSFDLALAACDHAVAREVGWSLRRALLEIPDGAAIVDLPTNFPLVVALQISMLAVLREHGLEASAVVGLSSGEVSSAFAAGAISLRDALRIAVHGGRLMNAEASALRMILVWLPERDCDAQLAPYGDRAAIAGMMEPGVTVVSGERATMAALATALADRGTRSHALPFPWGVHTPLIARARAEFEEVMRSVDARPPALPIVSTSLGRWAGTAGDFALPHWWDLFRAPVQLSRAVTAILGAGAEHFVEVGPDSALTYLIPRLGGRATAFDEALATARGRS